MSTRATKNIAKEQQIKELKEFLEGLDCLKHREDCGPVEIVAEKDPSFVWGGRVLQVALPWEDTFKFEKIITSEAQNWAKKRDLYSNGYIKYLHAPLLMLTLREN